jgi:hypothetical protein
MLRCEPELALLILVTLAATVRYGTRAELGRYGRLAVLFGMLLSFLVVGDLRDGAPTHHGERTLLSIWLAGAVLAGDLLPRTWNRLTRRRRATFLAITLLSMAVGACVARPILSRRDDFIDRSLEIDIGRQARKLEAAPAGELLIDTPDFGYYAVMAGFRQPERAAAFDDRDPRHERLQDVFASPSTLLHRLRKRRSTWFVASRPHAAVARSLGSVRAENERFVLVEVSP